MTTPSLPHKSSDRGPELSNAHSFKTGRRLTSPNMTLPQYTPKRPCLLILKSKSFVLAASQTSDQNKATSARQATATCLSQPPRNEKRAKLSAILAEALMVIDEDDF